MFAIAILIASGCTTTGLRSKKAIPPEYHGMVRTEGALIKNKTLVIPPEGLTLIDVVEQCERKSITTIAGNSLTPEIGKILRQQNDLVMLDSTAFAIAMTNWRAGQSNENNQEIKAQVTKAKENLIDSMNASGIKLANENKIVVEDLFKAIVLIEPYGENEQNKLIAVFNNSLSTSAERNGQSDREADDQNTISSSPNNVPSQLVVLSRKNGRRIIVPIALVKGGIAGDIALADGDQIGIVPKEGFAAFTREGGEGKTSVTVALSGLTQRDQVLELLDNTTLSGLLNPMEESENELEQYVNVIVLQSLTVSGQLDEYILPNSRYPAFSGFKSELDPIVSSVYLQDGDHLHFSALELTPLILTSRAQNRQRQTQALRSRHESASQMQSTWRNGSSTSQGNPIARDIVDCQMRVSETLRAINPFRSQ